MTIEKRPPARLVELTEDEALELLSSVSLGRVVFSHQALPAIRPVNHIVEDGQVVILAHSGAAILGPAAHHAVVAYEADELDPREGTGWSVIVTGTASAVCDPAEVARFQGALEPWINAEMEHVIRINQDIVTGYRLVRDAS
ncbi:pyridoxamine 5'-phosphate oxidase family protein [Streptomyces sp. NPDC020096]